MRDIERGELRAPAWVIDIDIARDYGDEAVDIGRFATAWCLVRRQRSSGGDAVPGHRSRLVDRPWTPA